MCLTLLIPGGKGDTPRQLLPQAGPEIHPISPNRVQEACEGWDSVPSLHNNAKAVQVIARLYWEGASRAWVESSSR